LGWHPPERFGLSRRPRPPGVRILFLTQWFDPEPSFKGLLFAKELNRRGHQVSVLTGFPNYPGGKLYPGYRVRLWQRETMEGVNILRVPLYPSHDRSALGRVANYLSFALSAAVLGPLLTPEVDVVYVYHPPATVGLAALAFRWLRGVPCVYDVQDLWPDTLLATGMVRGALIPTLVGWWCDGVYRVVNAIVVLSPGFKRRLLERGVPAAKIDVIYNWCDEPDGGSLPAVLPAGEKNALAGRFNVVFAGNMGPAQDLDTVLRAARLVAVSHPAVQFVLVGGGLDTERLKTAVVAEGLANVIFLPRRPPSAIGAVLAAADVLLVHLRDNPLFAITIPSKTQAYLAAGRPVLMAVRGDATDLVREAQAGLTCEPGNAEQLAATVRAFVALPPAQREAMGEAGRCFYREHLALAHGVSKFERILHEVAAAQTLSFAVH
jgi:colanic acid biosynthesis glycosyl transferase WcaI